MEAEGGNPSCGDQTTFTVKIKNNTIQDIKFYGRGCAISVAAQAILTQELKGKPISEVKKMSEKEMLEKLGGIIQTRMKCALLGLKVLQEGIKKYEQNNHEKTGITI